MSTQATQREMMKAQGYVLLREAADKVGVHVSTIYRLVNRGDVTGTQLGKTRYVGTRSLADYYANPVVDAALGIEREPEKKTKPRARAG